MGGSWTLSRRALRPPPYSHQMAGVRLSSHTYTNHGAPSRLAQSICLYPERDLACGRVPADR
jgi:hypothetical protein